MLEWQLWVKNKERPEPGLIPPEVDQSDVVKLQQDWNELQQDWNARVSRDLYRAPGGGTGTWEAGLAFLSYLDEAKANM